MNYHADYEIGPESPGVWKEVRRLEAELAGLRHDLTTLQTAYDDEVEHYRIELARLSEGYEEKAEQIRLWQRHDIDLQHELTRLREDNYFLVANLKVKKEEK